MRTPAFLAVALALVVLVGGAFAVQAYDSAQENTIAEGLAVGGVDLGGLDRRQAEATLRDELLAPLNEPVIVRSRGQKFTLTAQVAHVKADVDGMVDEALRRSRQGNVLSRTWRNVTGGSVDADLDPAIGYSDRSVRNLVKRVARNVELPARDAGVRFTSSGVERVRSRDGLRLRRDDLRRRIEEALLRAAPQDRSIRARLERTKAKVTTRELGKRYGTIVHVDRGGYQLKLYKGLELVKSYPIAVGQVGLETPAGRYEVQNKAVNPAWSVPNSAWAGSLAGQVIPGGVPENPLKARWLGIYDGVGIHGTDARGSIGTNASHGCIRMLVEDVIELYDKVPVGASVYIA